MFDNYFMQEALVEATCAYNKNEVPVGVVIVDNHTNQIIARAHNNSQNQFNATLHAEIVAINQACKLLNSKYLTSYSLFSTLEPCAMCSGAISIVKLSNLYYGASDFKQGAVENGIRFFNSTNCFSRPNIYPDIMKDASLKLLKTFFKKIRS